MTESVTHIADYAIETLKKCGADACDVILVDSSEISFTQRLGKPEALERSESTGIGLRVLQSRGDGLSQAMVSSTNISKKVIDELAQRAVDMANAVPADPYLSLAEKGQFATTLRDLELCDDFVADEACLKQWAGEAEAAGLAVEGITNSDGADAAASRGEVVMATSEGFSGRYDYSSFSVSVSLVAGEGQGMETDYDYSYGRHADGLRNVAEIGRSAGERTVRRLGARKMDTGEFPVVFDRRVARSLLGSFSLANRIARQPLALPNFIPALHHHVHHLHTYR